mmetsp:Transcript_74960/g.208404  ORF Transcript_74960/g.208404 Transcript_74960/m.208404 type:complete len:85 (+) Transcript_74960:135-389(+)
MAVPRCGMAMALSGGLGAPATRSSPPAATAFVPTDLPASPLAPSQSSWSAPDDRRMLTAAWPIVEVLQMVWQHRRANVEVLRHP